MVTRTGADYLHFESGLCPIEQGGCGALVTLNETVTSQVCPNCEHRPLAHVSVTTADQLPGRHGLSDRNHSDYHSSGA